MWNSGKGWEKAVHMPSCVAYVTEEHMVFVKWALTYLTWMSSDGGEKELVERGEGKGGTEVWVRRDWDWSE